MVNAPCMNSCYCMADLSSGIVRLNCRQSLIMINGNRKAHFSAIHNSSQLISAPAYSIIKRDNPEASYNP